eukprot:scaffold345_cov44-Attheya_sp.AAC.3
MSEEKKKHKSIPTKSDDEDVHERRGRCDNCIDPGPAHTMYACSMLYLHYQCPCQSWMHAIEMPHAAAGEKSRAL